MLIVVVDPEQKNVVRGVFEVPDGFGYEAAETAVKKAYADWAAASDGEDIEDFLPEGFESKAFLSTEVS